MKKGNTPLLPISVTTAYLIACALLLYYKSNFKFGLIVLASSPVVITWIAIRIYKINALRSVKFHEDYYDGLDWGIGDYKKTWKKISSEKN